MGTNNETPARMAIHPGTILKEEIRERKMKQLDLAHQLGMQPSHLSEIIRGKRSITKSIADRLERVLGIPSIDWMRLQLAYDYDLIGLPRQTGLIEPVHPGRIIQAEIDHRGINPLSLAQEIGISPRQLNDLLDARIKLDTEIALMLEAATSLKAAWLLAMQNEYDISIAQHDISFMEKLKRIRQIAAAL